ncbi:MAG: putative protein YcbX [Chroococcopsis gigantea SAG 12.99]|jgi:uncharacterized protein YcbX|nr:MOSC domain-containing protein [Chlorogloea purpurea SAG 13.99]MDV3002247.1 putative protein YcbX [Chroococcopsis gigantea SAG 12.99]
MQVKSLHIYPLKSCRGISLSESEVTEKGFKNDREYMIVDDKGQFLTQRQYPKLVTLGVEIRGDNLCLSTAVSQQLELQPTLTGKLIPVRIWRDVTTAIDQGNEVARWLENFLGFPCRLVKQSPHHIRPTDPKYAIDDRTPVSFADGYPYLITNTASLEELNRRINDDRDKAPMDRFRANIVIETREAFIETRWREITIADVKFALVKPCTRCIITTTDQDTGERNPHQEPLKTLQTFRKGPEGIMFGENMIPRRTGIVKVGDEVKVINSSDS